MSGSSEVTPGDRKMGEPMQSAKGGQKQQRGRPRVFDEDKFLDGAVALFRRRSFSGVSISDITNATGLTTGSLYKAYKDKEGLFAKALARYITLREEGLSKRISKATNGRERLVAILRDYLALSQGRDGKLGCMVVAGISDLDQVGDVANSLRFQVEQRRAKILVLVEQGIEDGSIARGTDPVATAEVLIALLNGMRLVGKASDLTKDNEAFIASVMKILG